MAGKTKLGKDIIPEGLTGKEACIDYIIKYGDAYLNKINEMYPLVEVLDLGKDNNYYTRDLPLYPEHTYILDCILFNSVNARKWQPETFRAVDETEAQKYLDYVKKPGVHNSDKIYDLLDGINLLNQEGLVQVDRLNDKLIISPSQEFVEYCISQKNKLF